MGYIETYITLVCRREYHTPIRNLFQTVVFHSIIIEIAQIIRKCDFFNSGIPKSKGFYPDKAFRQRYSFQIVAVPECRMPDRNNTFRNIHTLDFHDTHAEIFTVAERIFPDSRDAVRKHNIVFFSVIFYQNIVFDFKKIIGHSFNFSPIS